MTFDHAEIGHEQGDGLGDHRATAIRMNRQLLGSNALLGARVGDQLLRKCTRLAVGDQLTDDVAAEDVEHHIQIINRSTSWVLKVE